MKNKLLLLIFLCIAWTLQAQSPPNGDFEEWEADGQYERPLGWYTNNMDNFESVSKSDDAYSGEYAVQLTANFPTFEGPYPGILEITVSTDPDNPPSMFHFTTKFEVTADTGQASALITLFGTGGSDFQIPWLTNEDITEYTSFDLPIDYSTISAPDSIKIQFFGGSVITGLGQLGNGILLVDDVRLDQVSLLQEGLVSGDWTIFPNPTADRIFFDWKENKAINKLEVIDLSGRVWWVQTSELLPLSIEVANWPSGNYVIRVYTDRGMQVQYFHKY